MYTGFFNEINTNKKLNILDAACGNGLNTKMLSEIFVNSSIVGVELNEDCINFANEYNNSNNIEYVHSDLFNYNTDIKYDYIFFLEILEHIRADKHYIIIDKLLGLLSEDGLLFISTPNELDNPDGSHGHIGFLNRERTKLFIDRYKNNIINSQFYDNKLLDSNNYIIDSSIDTFEFSSWGVGGL